MLRRELGEIDFDYLVGEGTCHPGEPVIAQGERDNGSTIDRERQNEALVVVGVLTNQVHTAGCRPQATRLVAEESDETSAHVLSNVARQHGTSTRLRPFLMNSAACSGVTSPIQAPIAASDPARYLSLLSARLGEVICNIKRISSRP